MSMVVEWIGQAATAVSMARALYPNAGWSSVAASVARYCRPRMMRTDTPPRRRGLRCTLSRPLRHLAARIAPRRGRRAAAHLSDATSDRELADIGLSRAQAGVAAQAYRRPSIAASPDESRTGRPQTPPRQT